MLKTEIATMFRFKTVFLIPCHLHDGISIIQNILYDKKDNRIFSIRKYVTENFSFFSKRETTWTTKKNINSFSKTNSFIEYDVEKVEGYKGNSFIKLITPIKRLLLAHR